MKKSNQSTSTFECAPNPAAERMLRYFDERVRVLLKSYLEARRYFSVEGIHGLRLETKKLRVWCGLVDNAAPGFDSKPVIGILRKLFRPAGQLRDIDICQAIALSRLQALDLSAYLNHLKCREMKLRALFDEAASGCRFNRIVRRRRKMRDALEAVDEYRLEKRTRKRMIQLASEINDRMAVVAPGTDDLHTIRKRIKSLQYTLDIRRICFGGTDPEAGVSDQLKTAGRNLGNWRDFLLAGSSVRDFLRSESQVASADPGVYATFQENLRQKADRYLKMYSQSRKPLHKSLDRISSGPARAQSERRHASR